MHSYPVFCQIILLQSKFAALVLVVVVVGLAIVAAVAVLLVMIQLLLPANSYS
jgi:hypothetical protein